MRVVGMVLLCERHCVPSCPCWPPVPPSSSALPPLRVLPVCPPVLLFFSFRVRALRCSRAPCVCPLLISVLPLSRCPAPPLTRLSPLQFSFSLSTLPVRLPSLSERRCHSCVPPACSTPAPPRRPYPFPWGPPHRSAPSVPVSHPILVALCPVGVGGVYLRTGLWPCPRTGIAVGFLRTMSHRMCRRNTERTSGRCLSSSLRCICTVEPSRIDQLRTRAPFRPGAVTKGSHFVAPRRCPMALAATKAWRGQPLRAGRV